MYLASFCCQSIQSFSETVSYRLQLAGSWLGPVGTTTQFTESLAVALP